MVGGDSMNILCDRPSRLASSAPINAWGPSTSWSTALPMSCNSVAVLATFTSAPISAAIAAAMRDASMAWCGWFWP